MYQAMSLVLACFVHLWDCINPVIPRVASVIQDLLPVDVIPMRHSVLFQILISALYSELINNRCTDIHKAVSFLKKTEEEHFVNKLQEMKTDKNLLYKNDPSQSSSASIESIALAIAEALCYIDEDNKHTEQIDEFLEQIKRNVKTERSSPLIIQPTVAFELLASHLSMTEYGKSSLKVCNITNTVLVIEFFH